MKITLDQEQINRTKREQGNLRITEVVKVQISVGVQERERKERLCEVVKGKNK